MVLVLQLSYSQPAALPPWRGQLLPQLPLFLPCCWLRIPLVCLGCQARLLAPLLQHMVLVLGLQLRRVLLLLLLLHRVPGRQGLKLQCRVPRPAVHWNMVPPAVAQEQGPFPMRLQRRCRLVCAAHRLARPPAPA